MSKKAKPKTRRQRPPRTAAGPPIRTQEPPVVQHEPPIDHGRYPQPPGAPDKRFWPLDEDLPSAWIKPRRRAMPCPACRRVLLDNGGQNSVCQSSGSDVAWFRCRSCGHAWCLPVREV